MVKHMKQVNSWGKAQTSWNMQGLKLKLNFETGRVRCPMMACGTTQDGWVDSRPVALTVR